MSASTNSDNAVATSIEIFISALKENAYLIDEARKVDTYPRRMGKRSLPGGHALPNGDSGLQSPPPAPHCR